jgi:hypothetical protein
MEHNINFGHRIHNHHTPILSTKPRYMDRIIRDAIKNELHPNNMTREDGFCLSKSWKPLISSLKVHRKPPSRQHIWVLREATQVHAQCPYQGTKYALFKHSSASTLMSQLSSTTSALSSPNACL